MFQPSIIFFLKLLPSVSQKIQIKMAHLEEKNEKRYNASRLSEKAAKKKKQEYIGGAIFIIFKVIHGEGGKRNLDGVRL
jgi:hypothetical protein